MLQTTRMTPCGRRGHSKDTSLHCTENPIYLFPEMQLSGLIPNTYIHVYVSDLYIPRICLHIWLQENRQADPWNTKIACRDMNVKIGKQNNVVCLRNIEAAQLYIWEHINWNQTFILVYHRPFICSVYSTLTEY
jgi:hypothetical protein